MNVIFCKFKKAQTRGFNFLQASKQKIAHKTCKPKKLKTHESNFYEAVNLSKSLKTASKDPVLVPGKCSRIGTESGKGIIPKHCTKGKFRYILRCLFRKLRKTKSTGGGRLL